MTDCAHPSSLITCRVVSNGTAQYVRQCVDCGEVVGSCISKPAALTEEPNPRPFDADFRDRKRKQARQQDEADAAKREDEWEAGQDDRRQWYVDYLQTKQWRTRRRLVLERAEYRCEGCGEQRATEVHHMTYGHVGCEFLWELRAVCVACHERLHP